MKMLCIKFHHNRRTNEEFDYSRVQAPPPPLLEGRRGTRFQKFEKSSYRMMVPTQIVNFSILAGLEKTLKSEAIIRLLGEFKAPRGGQVYPILKNWASPIQKGGPNPNPKFQHSSSIRKCLQIGGNYLTFGESKDPRGGQGGPISKIRKSLIAELESI